MGKSRKHVQLIYALIDPRSGQLMYVGKSCAGLERPIQHGSPSSLKKDKYSNRAKFEWLTDLQAASLKPRIEVLEHLGPLDDASEAECEWIAAARAVVPLLNKTDGGDGARLGHVQSAETRRKRSAKMRGRPQVGGAKTAEARARCGAHGKGRPLSPEHRAKISEGGRGKQIGTKRSEEACIANARARGGQAVMDETGTVYPTYRHAARALGVSTQTICNALKRGGAVFGTRTATVPIHTITAVADD